MLDTNNIPTELDESESQQTHFRGCWIPADIMQLFWDGKINSRETMLLATIDSLVSPEKGCWASNAYLASVVGLKSTTHLTEAIGKLKKLGLLFQTSFDGRHRYLETAWSRIRPTDSDRGRLSHLAGAAFSQSDGQRGVCIPGIGDAAPLKNHRAASPESGRGYPRNRGVHIDNKDYRKDSGANLENSHTPAKSGKGQPGFFDDSFYMKAADRLITILKAAGSDLVLPAPPKRGVQPTTIAKSVRQLIVDRQVSKQRVKAVIDWLKDHYEDEYTPKLHQAWDFSHRFKRIEDAMLRFKHEQETDEDDPQVHKKWLAAQKIMELCDDSAEPIPTHESDQPRLNEMLKELKLPAGFIKVADLWE